MSEAIQKAWREYMKRNAPIRADSKEWDAFLFAWNAAMEIAKQAMSDN